MITENLGFRLGLLNNKLLGIINWWFRKPIKNMINCEFIIYQKLSYFSEILIRESIKSEGFIGSFYRSHWYQRHLFIFSKGVKYWGSLALIIITNRNTSHQIKLRVLIITSFYIFNILNDMLNSFFSCKLLNIVRT